MLHATLLRSPFAHAKITGIDTSAAKGQPGVVAVFTGEDLAEDWDKNPQANPAAVTGYGMSLEERSRQGGASVTDTADTQDGPPVDEETRTFCAWIPTDDTKIPNHWPVARDEVNYAGDIVAVVVATDRYKAQDALEYIEVDYEPMDPVLDVDAAYEGDGPLVHEDLGTNQSFTWDLDVGEDIDETFQKADVVVKERYVQQRLIPNAIETRGVVANGDPVTGGYTVYTSTQIPHILKYVLAVYCGVPEQQLRVVAPDVGGGFGSKLNVYAEEAIALVLARKLGVPVKWIEDSPRTTWRPSTDGARSRTSSSPRRPRARSSGCG
jgi:carbon-monoxide dehydrogenase large subunit